MRRPIVAGNWKMNLDLAAGRDLIASIRAEYATAEPVEVVVCPPTPYLFPAAKALDGCEIRLGAQDIYYTKSGAYTGEVSAEMIAETGADFVILGHSERRHTIGHLEDDRMINLKAHAARRAGLTPILCVGETLAERDAEKTLEVLTFQLTAGIVGLDVSGAKDLVIAYEPVWAIGTGRNATPAQAQEAHAHLRAELRRLIGAAADNVRILYGGSVKPDNAGELFAQADVDGGLIGGASLKADTFVPIIRAAVAAAV
ncbi:MAG: triose-phosphate isomerase [Phycisphaerales bacterium]|nr:triose-phosphate isomerase [Phycisphaerales bacterium]